MVHTFLLVVTYLFLPIGVLAYLMSTGHEPGLAKVTLAIIIALVFAHGYFTTQFEDSFAHEDEAAIPVQIQQFLVCFFPSVLLVALLSGVIFGGIYGIGFVLGSYFLA